MTEVKPPNIKEEKLTTEEQEQAKETEREKNDDFQGFWRQTEENMREQEKQDSERGEAEGHQRQKSFSKADAFREDSEIHYETCENLTDEGIYTEDFGSSTSTTSDDGDVGGVHGGGSFNYVESENMNPTTEDENQQYESSKEISEGHTHDEGRSHSYSDHIDVGETHQEEGDVRSTSSSETKETIQDDKENETERKKSDDPQGTSNDGAEGLDEEDLAFLLKQGEATKKLSLSNRSIKKLPKEVLELRELVVLDLSANRLKKVTKRIGNLASLRRLSLNHNALTSLPHRLWGLGQLTALFLNNNKLKALSVHIKHLTNLKTLDFSSNKIEAIPTEIGFLTSLQELRARQNRLEYLPTTLTNLVSLKELALDGNPLVFPPRTVVKQGIPAIFAFLAEGKNGIATTTHPLSTTSISNTQKKQAKRKLQKVNQPLKKIKSDPVLKNSDPTGKLLQLQQELRIANDKLQAIEAKTKEELLKPKEVSKQNDEDHFEWEIQTSEITLWRRLGRGSYGEVWKGMWRNTPCAVKKIYTDNITEKVLSDLRREVDLLCKLRHPNVVLFMGACTKLPDPCIVMEFVSRGSLAKILLDESTSLDFSLKLEMLIDCARGVAYLHNCKPPIIHRDLKTENLLVDDNWQIKVADFGLAKSKTKTYAKTNCGTVGYAAPEVLQNKPYTEKADIYSFGVVMWEVYTREIPYNDINTIAVIRAIDKGETLPIPETCPKDYAQLMLSCWDLVPENRPNFATILQSLEAMLETALDGP